MTGATWLMRIPIVPRGSGCLRPGPESAAEAAKNAAGFWAGSLFLPTGPFEIRAEFAQGADRSWHGALHIPAQGVRNFELGVAIENRTVRFTMAGLPGEPTYDGRLSDDGSTIAGDYTEAGARFPFSLQRTTAEAVKAGPAVGAGIAGQGLTGHWLGVLKPTPNLQLRLALDVQDVESAPPDAVLISLDQQNGRMPLSSVSVRGGKVRFEIRRPAAVFEGTMNADGSELVGTWTQGTRGTPLVLKRQAKSAAVKRPQDPLRPYPYVEHEVSVVNASAGVTLAGTLTVPARPGPHPAVVLITGSGPQDRDAQVAGHRTFLVLADHLARAGIAVLRCDDRGVGKSTGKFDSALQSDFVGDTLAGVAWLRGRTLSAEQRVALGLAKPGAPNPQLKLAESPWLRDVLRIDPRATLQNVKCPVLALTGGMDLQVAAEENLPAIEAALTAAGNRRFTTRQLPGLNHLFQTCRNGAPFEYAQIEETFSPVALKEIAQWIVETVRENR